MDRTQLAVVGGGRAGASAAIEAARAGLGVTLIDENPIGLAMMGLDIPLYFGQRMMPTIQDKGLMLQRVVSSSGLLKEAQEVGVEVLLGTYVWGSFRNQENSRQLERPVLGLADEERSWLLEYDRLVLATGARDLVLGFPGRELVGVMGASAALSLMGRYQALTSKRMVVLGSGELGLSTARQAIEQGIHVAAIVDVSPEVRGGGGLREHLEGQGVPFYTSHTVKEARGHREVESIAISRVNDDLQPIDGT
ncbi:MAG: FAD/NAD(P)-binding oxidoreductase, partial [Dehalococcoidia bacterium]